MKRSVCWIQCLLRTDFWRLFSRFFFLSMTCSTFTSARDSSHRVTISGYCLRLCTVFAFDTAAATGHGIRNLTKLPVPLCERWPFLCRVTRLEWIHCQVSVILPYIPREGTSFGNALLDCDSQVETPQNEILTKKTTALLGLLICSLLPWYLFVLWLVMHLLQR